jgi:hypothetical protein
MTITLYYAPVACSLVPYVALTEARADFDVRVVNFMQGMTSGITKVAVSGFSNCNAHFNRMSQRASVQKLLAFEVDTLAAMQKAS